MSLINDALKKAQKQRTGEAPPLASLPSVGGQSAASISRRAKPAGFDTLVLRAGIGAGVVIALVVGGYFAFRTKSETGSGGPASLRAGSGSEAATAGEKNGPQGRGPSSGTTAKSQVSESAPAPAFTLPIAAVPAPASSPAAKRPDEPSVALAKEGQASSPAVKASLSPLSTINSQPVAAAPLLKLEPRAMTFIDNLKVAGIRASATDSKVLMNDRVYRLGDIVEHEMGLKLVGITSNSLTFEDEKGGRYMRTF